MNQPDQLPAQVPLTELLRSVPEASRVQVHEAPFHSRFIPVGRYCHDAAGVIALERARADALQAEIQRTWFVIKDAGHHPGRTDDLLADVVRSTITAERERAERAEAELKTRNKSPVDRLHNICRAIEEESDGSAFSREEWDRIDAGNLALRKRADALEAALRRWSDADAYLQARSWQPGHPGVAEYEQQREELRQAKAAARALLEKPQCP